MRAALVAIALAGCARDDAAGLGAPAAVKLAIVQRAGAPPGTHYSAQIAPATELKVAFKVGGYVASVAKLPGLDGAPRAIQAGDPVRDGMQLAQLRKSDFQHQLAEARAARAQAGAAAHQASLDFKRATTLLSHAAVAGAEVDAARTQLSGAAAALAGAQARYDEAKQALADATLVAPLDGVVLARNVNAGELVAPGTVAFSVADTSSVKAEFGVPDTMLSRLAVGMPEVITTDAYPGETFEGKITLIAPSADAHSRVFEVAVTIPNVDGRLKVGGVAQLALDPAKAAADAPLVPISAIVRSPQHAERFAVYVVELKGTRTYARAREVELDDYLGRAVPVKHGLDEGDRVIVQGAKLVSDGEEVEVIP